MLLNDIDKPNSNKISKINRYLKEEFGITLESKVKKSELVKTFEDTVESLTEMRNNMIAPSNEEYAKKILIAEGLKIMIERRTLAEYKKIIKNYADYCFSNIASGNKDKLISESVVMFEKNHADKFSDIEVDAKADISSELALMVAEKTITELEANDLWTQDLIDVIIDSIIDNKRLPQFVINDLEMVTADEADEVAKELFGKVKYLSQFKDRFVERFDEATWDIYNKNQVDAADKYLKNKGSVLSLATIDEPSNKPVISKNGETMQNHFAYNRAKQDNKGKLTMKENAVKQFRMLIESEVEEAEVLISAKSFGLELQVMAEKVGRLQNEDLPPVGDQMRETYGMATSSAFMDMMVAQLETVLTDLRTAKEKIDTMVFNIATGNMSANDMDEVEPEVQDDYEVSAEPEIEPEIAVSDRSMKESKIEAKRKKIEEAAMIIEQINAIKAKIKK